MLAFISAENQLMTVPGSLTWEILLRTEMNRGQKGGNPSQSRPPVAQSDRQLKDQG